MTDSLLKRNSFSDAPKTAETAIIAEMPEADPKKVGERLRALMLDPELGASTVTEFAKLVGAERNAASAWLNGYNFPRVPSMAKLIDHYPGLTLDWIYFGVADAVPVKLYIKLQALLERVPVPRVGSEPGEPVGPHRGSRKTRKNSPSHTKANAPPK